MTSGENYAVFRECLSNAIVARSEEKPTRRKPKVKRAERKDLRSARLTFGFRRVGFSSERATMALDKHSRNTA
jgi:hypothetical protein